MQSQAIMNAAQQLMTNRLSQQKNPRLAKELRPKTTEEALSIQQAMGKLMADSGKDVIAGWKCSQPFKDTTGENIVAAPLYQQSIYKQSPCPILLDEGICKIEPEIAFCLKHDLPSRTAVYSEWDIMEAIEGAYLALELIQNRYFHSEQVPYVEHLADCLFNQGVFIGPQINLENALKASEIEFTLTQTGSQTIQGKHPNQVPQAPLFWLVNFLRQRGIDLKAGQVIITGSYAGVLEVEANQDFSLSYQDLEKINLSFTAR